MSDDDRDIDIESDAEKRAHHNALERKRRDHIKDSFNGLKESVPTLQGEKQASRAQILNKATEYIQFMRRKNNAHQLDIDDLKRQNDTLDKQIRALEKAKTLGNYDPSSLVDSDGTQLFTNHKGGPLSAFDGGSDSDSDSSTDSRTAQGRPKRLKTTTVSSKS
uniref:Protein max-like isoform X2 n=1 Tax=Saccoglossus kowalevskii TaxID=10224 RepID=A0ABM0MBN2_SACKO|nr:PREDICTED: protein max-like isoform X2 [Saccoglossus kowalevskii]